MITHIDPRTPALIDVVRFLRSSLRSPAHVWHPDQRAQAEQVVRDSEALLGIKPLEPQEPAIPLILSPGRG